jgi:hypothetical protein
MVFVELTLIKSQRLLGVIRRLFCYLAKLRQASDVVIPFLTRWSGSLANRCPSCSEERAIDVLIFNFDSFDLFYILVTPGNLCINRLWKG